MRLIATIVKLIFFVAKCVNVGNAVNQPSIEYSLQSTSTGVCITCIFLDSSATDCVAVVHQRISQLNSSGLMNIESSHKLIRSGDTASGCIEGINLTDFQTGVIGAKKYTVSVQQGLAVRQIHACIYTPICYYYYKFSTCIHNNFMYTCRFCVLL